MKLREWIAISVAAVCAWGAASPSWAAGAAGDVRTVSGVKGGLSVVLGVGDGALLAEVARDGKFLVHALDPDEKTVEKARGLLQGQGLYGRASVERSDLQRLPYADNLVNLLVAGAGAIHGLPLPEILRVLVPNGVALIGPFNAGPAGRPPLPEAELQSVLAAAGIKDFEIVKQNGLWARIKKPRPKGMDDWTHFRYSPEGNMTSNDTLVGPPARLQWYDTPPWVDHYMGVESEVAANGRLFYVTSYPSMMLVARDGFNGTVLWQKALPKYVKNNMCRADAPGLIVAVGDRLYAALEYPGPVSELDAATGEALKTYTQGGRAEYILFCDGALVIMDGGGVRSIDAASGKLNWLHAGGGRQIVAADGRAILLGDRRLSAIGLADGKDLWSVSPKEQGGGAGTLQFCKQGVVVTADGYMGKNVYGFSATDGKYLWTASCPAGKHGDANVFFADGLIWTALVENKGWAGIDPLTGEEKKNMPYPGGVSEGRRCYPFKGAGSYFVMANLQMFDRRDGTLITPRVARGSCGSGSLPANGLLYAFPQGCRCTNWLRGYSALAPAAPGAQTPASFSPLPEKGPAFGTSGGASAADDWPTFRHDGERSGATAAAAPAGLKVLWSQEVGGALTGPIVSGGKVFVAVADRHRVSALDAAGGKPLWSFTAGGRVDTPPTIHEGVCLFGSDDGWVYALAAADGKLSWRLRAAPVERRIVSRGQVASAWPVHGCVLVSDGTACFAAGFNSELEDGIQVTAADPRTGQVKWSERVQGLAGQGAVNDLMLADGGRIYMNERRFDAANGRQERGRARLNSGEGGRSSLIFGSTQWGTGLNEEYYRRSVWHYGDTSGQSLVFKGEKVYGLTVKPARDPAAAGQYGAFGSAGGRTPLWTVTLSVRANALLLAGETVFAAGSPDEPEAWGGLVVALSAADGKEVGRVRLDAPTVPGGLAAAGGQLFASTGDGRVVCLGN